MTTDRKAVFAAVADKLPGIWSMAGTIPLMDQLIDKWEAGQAPPVGTGTATGGEWVDLAAPLIEQFEGYAKKLPDGGCQAYPDPGTGGKPWTIGIGSTTNESGQPIAPGTIWTRERAIARFKAHLAEFGEGVDKLLAGKPATAAQKAALTSLAYNIGLGALGGSTVLRRHRAGDFEGAANAFGMWSKAGGKTMAGLVRRRAAEAELYRS